MKVAELLPLLQCAVCRPRSILSAPTTLRCGHSVCSVHVADAGAPCPLSPCTPQRSPSIPSSSNVSFLPADPRIPLVSSDVRTQPCEPRVDVTLNKLIGLFSRAQRWEEEEEKLKDGNHFVGEWEGDSDSEAEHEFVQLPEGPDTQAESNEQDPLEDHGQRQVEHQETGARDRPLRLPSPSEVSGTPPRRSPAPTRTGASRPREPSPSSPTTRPRKRRRRSVHPERHSHDESNDRLAAESRFEKELISELTCEICFTLLYQPVTTPCQHTFCAKCLQRALDHSTVCPLCRQELSDQSYFQDHASNTVLLSIILEALPELYTERRMSIEAEERDARLDTPIFVCQLSFPGMPTLLHFFEPRYRLMLRRCLDSPTPRFGMIMPPSRGSSNSSSSSVGTDFGTMLEIRNVQILQDGRSMVETWGTHRFRIMERGTLDGYMVGRIERIDDYPEELDDIAFVEQSAATLANRHLSSSPTPGSSNSMPPSPPLTNEQLMATCHSFLAQLRQGMAPWVVQRLSHTYGPMPSDASRFSFWVALILPIDEHEKAKLLPIKSPRLRLRLVVHWIEQLNSNWWFSSGCVVV